MGPFSAGGSSGMAPPPPTPSPPATGVAGPGAPILENAQGGLRLDALVKASVDHGVDRFTGQPLLFQLHQAGQQVGWKAVHIQGAGKNPCTGILQRRQCLRREGRAPEGR